MRMLKRGLLLSWLCAAAAGAQDSWTLEKPGVWARDKEAVALSKDGDVLTIKHTGENDWSLHGFPRIPTKPGELFELNARVKLESDAQYMFAELCVILRDAQGKELVWSYGGAKRQVPGDWAELKTRFIVPVGGASVEPRLIGVGAAVVHAERISVRRNVGEAREPNPARLAAHTMRRGDIRWAYDEQAGTIEVTHAQASRVWRMPIIGKGWMILNAEETPNGLALTILNPETIREARAVFALTPQGELTVSVDSPGPQSKPLDFPPPFATRKGDRLIVPMNEGMSYPVEEEHQGLWRMIAYGGHGICMAFFGAMEDTTGAGWMCILETSDDAAMDVHKGADGLWQASPSWDAQRGEFGYTRKARYVFFGKGGHVAMCKRYREHAKQAGLLVPFSEKVKQRPKIDLLIGAANIWNWDAKGGKAALVAEMQAAGMERILWSGAGNAKELGELNALPKVLTSRYDIYQDIMDPAHHEKVGYVHGDWVTEAFPHDINWRGPNGDWRRGWQVRAKDKTMIPCAVICDAKALPYVRKRISEELKTHPYSARFIDTTVAAPWFECYHPDHPMTRSQSRHYKMELLRVISSEFGLVCGSETGHDASVPFCDFFEGMLSLGNYRVPDSGRDMLRVWDEVPAPLAKYQVGAAYRLPLWELVYHDCVVAQWYWGDYNNKLPKVWRKRDLFNALYGTPPMYMFTMKQWTEMKDRFVASYKTAAPVARATGYHEMTDHRILTADRSVQRTAFANGVTVTVNFGDTPWRAEDGAEISAMDLRVTGM